MNMANNVHFSYMQKAFLADSCIHKNSYFAWQFKNYVALKLSDIEWADEHPVDTHWQCGLEANQSSKHNGFLM